ncbi:hypothetical protein H5410_028176 [Solanum commersonii]|uniref:Uncharacterized protein n=1 Tax=Solanum commersonii TaxID=4109 RepID=A0A9J5Z5F2_SOLCO|nr:hypothetical protein H5410_028176 [Solanum commersonii]
MLESGARRSKSSQNIVPLQAFERLMGLNRRLKYNFIALMEPFQDPKQLDQYKRKLGCQNAYCNVSAKIWVFWEDDWKGEVLRDSMQQITLKLSKKNVEMICTAVCASDGLRDVVRHFF